MDTPVDPLRRGVGVILVVLVGYALVAGRPEGALGCAVAVAVSFAPLLAWRALRVPVPRALERLWVVGVGLIGASVALGLFDSIWQWGKLVHGLEALCVTAMGALLLLGYRERSQQDLPMHVAAVASICIGITFGAFWEFTEYLLDWLWYSDLQKSNADTMTDMLWNDLVAIATTLAAFHLYHHALSRQVQGSIGAFADALLTPIGQFLERHGRLAAVLIVLAVALYVAALWFAGRPVPGLPSD